MTRCKTTRLGECLFNFPVRLVQRFGQYARFADGGYEVGVGDPAREDVHVNMSSNSGTGGLTDVHPKIYSVGIVEGSQHTFEPLGEFHHFGGSLGGELLELIGMFVGYDHHVARGIGKGIEDDEAEPGTMDDEGWFVVFRGFLTKDTAFGFIYVRDVLIAPWSPNVVHVEKGSRRFASHGTRGSSHTCVMFGPDRRKSLN